MIVDLENTQEQRLPQFKGGKGEYIVRMFTDDACKIMYGKLEPGCSIGMHSHETNSEMIYILSGEADFLYNDTTEKASAGDCHYCPKGHSHSMMNNSDKDLVFFAVVPER